ncbi:MAG: hypothetical protein KAT93_04245 [Desulfuromonadales bacterium]|jgi:hypothetical protein|nr:hypothetical protein [Desulfuromonadales bacterium]
MTTLEFVNLPADQLNGDAVAVLYFEDQRPLRGPCAVVDWRLDGQLTRLLLDGQLTGRAGEHAVFQNNAKLHTDWSLFVGGGKWDGLCLETYTVLIRHLLANAYQAGFRDLAVCLPLFTELSEDSTVDLVRAELDNENLDFTACRLSLVEGLMA